MPRNWVALAAAAALPLANWSCAATSLSQRNSYAHPPAPAARPAPAQPGVAKLSRPASAGDAAHNSTGIQLASYEDSGCPSCPPNNPYYPDSTGANYGDLDAQIDAAVQVCPVEPRCPSPGPHPCAPGLPIMEAIAYPSNEKYPDEYLCDGGDRGDPFHYEGTTSAGLETEDTVGEYVDHTGKRRAKPSTKVCIYAPRFASVRSVCMPRQDLLNEEVGNTARVVRTQDVDTNLGWSVHTKFDPTVGLRMRSSPSGLDSKQLYGGLNQTVALKGHKLVQNTFENSLYVQAGLFEMDESAWLSEAIQAAAAWSKTDALVIAAKTETSHEAEILAKSDTLVFVEDRESNKPGELTLIKLADKSAASPGDVIEFTIRYDNRGPRELKDVRITDNLTGRLEYIEGSATSDRDAQFGTVDNGEGSVALTWIIQGELKGKTGGVVTFKARVR